MPSLVDWEAATPKCPDCGVGMECWFDTGEWWCVGCRRLVAWERLRARWLAAFGSAA